MMIGTKAASSLTSSLASFFGSSTMSSTARTLASSMDLRMSVLASSRGISFLSVDMRRSNSVYGFRDS